MVNSDLQGRYRFDVFSVAGEVEAVGHPASGHRIETTDYQLAYYRFFGKHRRR